MFTFLSLHLALKHFVDFEDRNIDFLAVKAAKKSKDMALAMPYFQCLIFSYFPIAVKKECSGDIRNIKV
jgi:hypothetical protein